MPSFSHYLLDHLGGFDAVKAHYPHLIERTQEIPREKRGEDLPPTPDAVDKENFVMTEIIPHIFVGMSHYLNMTSLSKCRYVSSQGETNFVCFSFSL